MDRSKIYCVIFLSRLLFAFTIEVHNKLPIDKVWRNSNLKFPLVIFERVFWWTFNEKKQDQSFLSSPKIEECYTSWVIFAPKIHTL